MESRFCPVTLPQSDLLRQPDNPRVSKNPWPRVLSSPVAERRWDGGSGIHSGLLSSRKGFMAESLKPLWSLLLLSSKT